MALFWSKACSLLGALGSKATHCQLPVLSACSSKFCVARGLGSVPSGEDFPKPPRRPYAPYFRFNFEKREQLVRENPGLVQTEYSKLVGNLWRNLPTYEREKYTRQYEEEAEVYRLEYEEYMATLTDEQKIQLEMLSLTKRLKRKKIKRKRMLRELGKPKRPVTAFLYYVADLSKGTHTQARQHIRSIADQWQKLTDEEKKVYVEKSKEDQIRYKEEIEMWEERMWEEGRPDLIRGYEAAKKKKIESSKYKKKTARKSKSKMTEVFREE